MPMIDNLLGAGVGANVAPTAEPEEQAAHSAAPESFSGVNSKTIIGALIGICVLICCLHFIEGWLKG